MPINLPANNGSRVIDCFSKDEGEADFMSVPESIVPLSNRLWKSTMPLWKNTLKKAKPIRARCTPR